MGSDKLTRQVVGGPAEQRRGQRRATAPVRVRPLKVFLPKGRQGNRASNSCSFIDLLSASRSKHGGLALGRSRFSRGLPRLSARTGSASDVRVSDFRSLLEQVQAEGDGSLPGLCLGRAGYFWPLRQHRSYGSTTADACRPGKRFGRPLLRSARVILPPPFHSDKPYTGCSSIEATDSLRYCPYPSRAARSQTGTAYRIVGVHLRQASLQQMPAGSPSPTGSHQPATLPRCPPHPHGIAPRCFRASPRPSAGARWPG